MADRSGGQYWSILAGQPPAGILSGEWADDAYALSISVLGMGPGGQHGLAHLPLQIGLLGGFAGAGGIPTNGLPAMENSAPEMLVSKSPRLYDPLVKPPRDFKRDYPNTEGFADASGKLTRDIEGRPLQAQIVAGRRS